MMAEAPLSVVVPKYVGEKQFDEASSKRRSYVIMDVAR